MAESFSYRPSATKITKTKSKARSTAVPHPAFIQLKKYTKDPYWLIRFDEYAMNTFPRNFRMSGNDLYFQKNGTKYNLLIDVIDEQMAQNVIAFFHKHACIYSTLEHEQMRRDVPTVEKKWKNLKPFEKRKEIENFCLARAKEWELTKEETEEFRSSMIEYILDSGQVKSNRIILEDGHIVDIEHVTYNEKWKKNSPDPKILIKLTAKRTTKVSNTPKVDPIIKSWADALKKMAVARAAIK